MNRHPFPRMSPPWLDCHKRARVKRSPLSWRRQTPSGAAVLNRPLLSFPSDMQFQKSSMGIVIRRKPCQAITRHPQTVGIQLSRAEVDVNKWLTTFRKRVDYSSFNVSIKIKDCLTKNIGRKQARKGVSSSFRDHQTAVLFSIPSWERYRAD